MSRRTPPIKMYRRTQPTDLTIVANYYTSVVSLDDLRVQPFEFGAGVGGGELPVDAGLIGVAIGGPGAGFAVDRGGVGDASAQALTRQYAQFTLGDVQPRAVLRRVHQFDPVRQPQRLGRTERRVQRRDPVRVEVVAHQRDSLGLGVTRIVHQRTHPMRPIHRRASSAHTHVAPPAQRLVEHPHAAHALADVFMIDALFAARRRDRLARLADQLLGLFVHAHHRTQRIVRPRIRLQHLLHRRHERRVMRRRDAPHLPTPRLYLVF